MHTSDEELVIEDLTVRYGPVTAVNSVSLRGSRGSIISVIGPNGAGKSSLLKGISGIVPHREGRVRVGLVDLSDKAPYEIARIGIAHVPEGRRVVAPLTIEENLLLGGEGSGRLDKELLARRVELAYQMFPFLSERRDQPSGLLSGGQQQMLVIARGLMANPSWLLMDEPSMGLAPVVIEEVYDFLERLKSGSYDIGDTVPGVLLAEQSTAIALDISDYVYVMNRGSFLFEGLPGEIRGNTSLLKAYLGT